MSKSLGELVVRSCKASEFQDCDLVFSGLDSDVAGQVGKLIVLALSLIYTEGESSQKNWSSFKQTSPSFPMQRTTGETRWFHSSSRLLI